MYGKSIELFLVDGDPNGVITAELSNWNGKAIKIPRTEIVGCDREDLKSVGVYILFCQDEDKSCYIGEAENIISRLNQHLRDYQSGKEEYYWNTAVVFLGRDLNKAHIRYLENRFVEIAKECNNYSVLTQNTFKNTVLKESQIASMEEFIQNAKILIDTLGYNIFTQPPKPTEKTTYFICKHKDTDAKGFLSNEGFTVLKGSKISGEITKSFEGYSYDKLRNRLIENETIKDCIFQKDYEFSSPSAASAVICGRHSNGRIDWRTEDGIKLKDFEERKSE